MSSSSDRDRDVRSGFIYQRPDSKYLRNDRKSVQRLNRKALKTPDPDTNADFSKTPEGNYGVPLPPGYRWDRQKMKYCSKSFSNRFHFTEQQQPSREKLWKDYRTLPDVPGRTRPDDRNFNTFSGVFTHRGLYDRALKIPENSEAAIVNGSARDLWLHEVDVRVGKLPRDWFLGHDVASSRVTPHDTWAQEMTALMQTQLVNRRLIMEDETSLPEFAASHEGTGERVPLLAQLLNLFGTQQMQVEQQEENRSNRSNRSNDDEDSSSSTPKLSKDYKALRLRCLESCTIQVDVREDDLPKAMAFYRWKTVDCHKLILKGYNLRFDNGDALLAAMEDAEGNARQRAAEAGAEQANFFSPRPQEAVKKDIVYRKVSGKDEWAKAASQNGVRLIMVFYSRKIIELAVRGKQEELDARRETWEGLSINRKKELLDYKYLLRVATKHIRSFTDMIILNFGQIIPEIVHSGLGLGYNVETGEAKNPINGVTIEDPEVQFESRVDRVLIEVSLGLRFMYPQMVFSSCTRLCEVRTPDGEELVADMRSGRLKRKPTGEKGISTTLRAMHGGLYPQSDIVVADDPYAEIAARTWIDEYKGLDRSKLINMTYNDWIAEANDDDFKNVIDNLNGAFLPNTYHVSQADYMKERRKGNASNRLISSNFQDWNYSGSR